MAPDTCFLSSLLVSTPLRTGRAGSGEAKHNQFVGRKTETLQRLEVAGTGLSLVRAGPWGELKL
ncbi:rCG63564 [Rattus norvegicus]|uniref:RCG63564 n=1 Tax=Rattus norvegicus TaxID=10116 RepID=A6IW50_RAT|nr:rCG63564 [Rattus norvegicus]